MRDHTRVAALIPGYACERSYHDYVFSGLFYQNTRNLREIGMNLPLHLVDTVADFMWRRH